YSGVFPVWVAIEVLSFSTLSMLFKNLKNKDKQYISKHYYNVHFKYTQSWLHTLTTIRNICAHHGRLYGKKLSIQPQLFDDIREKVSNDEIFAAIIVLSKLLSSNERLNLSISLKALIEEYDEFIDISHLGFPKDWDNLL
ncbi:MAG: Abi family protein, partial [Firmicutes bacterium]|nr:Abi family protein [Bacillota bacterium]